MKLLCVLFAFVMTSSVQAQLVQKDVLRMGAPDNHIPFAGVSEDESSFKGYEIEITNEICKRLSLKCEYTLQSWASMVSSVRFKKYDMAVGGMSITPDRKRVITFSNPISISPARFVINKNHTKKNEFMTLSGFIGLNQLNSEEQKLLTALKGVLSGQKVAIVKGTNHLKFIEEEMGGLFKQIKVNTTDELVDMVNSGQADFGVSDVSLWESFDKAKIVNIAVGGPLLNEGEIGDGVGFPIRFGNETLQATINEELDKMKADGTMQKLADKWGLPMPK